MKSCHDVRFRVSRVLMALGTLLALSLPTSVYAQTTTCGPEVKEEALASLAALVNVDDLQKVAREAELYKKYSFCLPPTQTVPSALVAAARQCGATISQLGSIFFEVISCAGYEPHRRQFAVPVKIKQQFGFGGSPLPGSPPHECAIEITPDGTPSSSRAIARIRP